MFVSVKQTVRPLLPPRRRPALATAVATNAAPFEIPVLRSPPAPRVLPDTFVLPEIPQEWRE